MPRGDGIPADSLFNISFFGYMGLKGPNNAKAAYLWANRPFKASYAPASGYHFSTAEQAPHVTRQGVGRYTVTLPGMPEGRLGAGDCLRHERATRPGEQHPH